MSAFHPFARPEASQRLSKQEYRERVPVLRERLLAAQGRLRVADFPVIVLFAGVDGAGKGDVANLLSTWMDPRHIVTRAFDKPTQEERERPEFWRFWRALPPSGTIGTFLSAWYHDPLLQRVYRETTAEELDRQLEKIVSFEEMLRRDGALILKFWLHLDKAAQRRRFKQLEADRDQSWRVTKVDWKHWRMYERFIEVSEAIIDRTSVQGSPWTIVEGDDHRYSGLTVGTALLEAIEARVGSEEAELTSDGPQLAPAPSEHAVAERPTAVGNVLASGLDMDRALGTKAYGRKLQRYRARLNELHRRARDEKVSTILVFEGWDASGKGGAIRRVTAALDARDYQVISIAAPTDEEKRHHYLWRFWRHLPRAGRVTIFDRSWYGRVLVERVEGLATEEEWGRAYGEILDFERQLVDDGVVLVKFWIHITPEEQEARFTARSEVPYKRWKLTEEDWRNRARWAEYESAAHDMIEQTSTEFAPWTVVEGNDKRYARVKVIGRVCEALEAALEGTRVLTAHATDGGKG